MEEFEAAKEAFEAGHQLTPDNTFKTWIRKCDAELEGVPSVRDCRMAYAPVLRYA